MGLSTVWVQTVADGLIRADAIVGITTHRTPAIGGKPARWLLDVVLPTTIGSGSGEGWVCTPLHRTLTQTDDPPTNAPHDLARLLAQLDAVAAAGVVSLVREHPHEQHEETALRFRFTPFSDTRTGRHDDHQTQHEENQAQHEEAVTAR